jgi:hypothetical protein
MAWYSSVTGNPATSTNYDWENTVVTGATALSVKPAYTAGALARLKWKIPSPGDIYVTVPKTFNSNKTYLFKTKVRRLDLLTAGMSFSLSPGWVDTFRKTSSVTTPNGFTGQTYSNLYFYSSPASQTTTKDYATYRANNLLGLPGIMELDIFELNWKVNGFMYADRDDILTISSSFNTLGWKYLDTASQSGYIWFDDNTSTNYPMGGTNDQKEPNTNYRSNNFLTKFVNFQFFNFYFNYNKVSGGTNDLIKIYLSDTAPPNTTSTSSFITFTSSATLLAEIGDTGQVDASFFGLKGNRYITIVGPKSATYSVIALSGIKLEGGYHPGNNELYTMSLPNITTNLQGATYSAFVGNGNTINATASLVVNKIYSKVGNGKFKSGIWENGVWNNGWREDEMVSEFDDIDLSIRSLSDSRWRWRIIGPSASVEQFSVGDNISIGNIVAIDINGDRKLLKDVYQIIAASASGIDGRRGYITVESDTTFPYLRIERDSINHKIKITKNIWLSGAFLNGYYTGVWSYGLFKGYPLISEMYDTHWIDGKFEGGHFNSENYTYPDFVDTYYSNGKVGLTFSTPHGLAVGDIITIDKTDKTLNPEYDGETTIIEVPHDKLVVTDLDWGLNSSNETGSISTSLNSSVIQNMEFKSLNVSKITSNVSMDSDAVFTYNSWMDLVYDNTSATNIGKPQSLINSVSQKSYSENNLYGYITNDILSSNSSFRDSFSTVTRNYKLGTKYKIFSDFIGDSGLFENYFNPAGTNSNSQTFLDQGWTYSWASAQSITFSRTVDIGQDLITGKELQVDAIGSGGILDLQPPTIIVNNRDNSELPKLRYTAIQFDLIASKIVQGTAEADFSELPSPYNEYKIQNQPNVKGGPNGSVELYPSIHFNNLNFITRDVSFGTFGTYSQLMPASFLPINENVNHIFTPKMTKIEYFFNKRNLGMHFLGTFQYGVIQTKFIIDNMKFVELNMIPFFQYFTDENINIGVQVPYQGIAPFIEYSNSNFFFIDNINIGLDSFDVTTQYELYSGVGSGIGSIISTGGIFITPGVEATGTPQSRGG